MAHTESQEHILDAVMVCIVREGVDGASMRNVASEADVSLGLLSYHFEDRRSLIVAAFQRACDRVLATSQAAIVEVDDPDERVRSYLRGAFDEEFLTGDYLTLRLWLWAASRTDDEIAQAERSLYQRYVDVLVELVSAARPSIGADEVMARATDAVVMQNGLWLNWARYRSEADLERGLTRCQDIALDGR